MKRKALFAVCMLLVWGGVAGARVYASVQQAGQAQASLAGHRALAAQVLSVSADGRRGGNAAVRVLARPDPSGSAQPATLSLAPQQFDDADALRPGAVVDMLYDPATQRATERALLEKQSRWTYWLFK